MSLVQRLRGWLDEPQPLRILFTEAADEIERLTAELVSLREHAGIGGEHDKHDYIHVARADLKCDGKYGVPCRHLPLGIGPECHELVGSPAKPNEKQS